jgi:hypothetical protein
MARDLIVSLPLGGEGGVGASTRIDRMADDDLRKVASARATPSLTPLEAAAVSCIQVA